MAVDKLKSGA